VANSCAIFSGEKMATNPATRMVPALRRPRIAHRIRPPAADAATPRPEITASSPISPSVWPETVPCAGTLVVTFVTVFVTDTHENRIETITNSHHTAHT